MPKEMELRCRCGEVVGRVENASPQKVNRVVCYCDDCQAFAHQLGRADLLNAQGGTDIIQVAPAALTFVKGQQHIAGLRLSPKGLFRFHTTCCNTPVGNTLSPAIPFVGIVAVPFFLWSRGFYWTDLGLLLGMYFLTALGITVGFHRLFTHRSFETYTWVKFILAVLGSMAVQGPLLKWAARHRRHHQFLHRLDPPDRLD